MLGAMPCERHMIVRGNVDVRHRGSRGFACSGVHAMIEARRNPTGKSLIRQRSPSGTCRHWAYKTSLKGELPIARCRLIPSCCLCRPHAQWCSPGGKASSFVMTVTARAASQQSPQTLTPLASVAT